MSVDAEYIIARTRQYTREALEQGLIVTPQYDTDHDGQHPESKRDLDTPTSFIEDMVQVWTLDKGYPPEEEARIQTLVTKSVEMELTEELKRFL